MTQTADTRPGHYYVSIRKETGQTCLALGPFAQHEQALAEVDRVWSFVRHAGADPYHALAYGTCRLPLDADAPDGKLNTRLSAQVVA